MVRNFSKLVDLLAHGQGLYLVEVVTEVVVVVLAIVVPGQEVQTTVET